MQDVQEIEDEQLFSTDTNSLTDSEYRESNDSDDDKSIDSNSSKSDSDTKDSVRNYLNQFDLTRIYRAWKSSQDDKSKEAF